MTGFGALRASALAFACAGVCSSLSLQASAAGLYEAESSLKDEQTIYVPSARWSGFYIGGHVGGGWSDSERRTLSVAGGAGGGGGGGGGDNNWANTKNDNINGGRGDDGIDGGAGGRAGNLDDAGEPILPGSTLMPERRIGGVGGDGGSGGRVSGKSGDGNFLIGGVHLGYNWQRGDMVFGVEGDASFDDSLDNYLTSLRARVGVVRNNLLLYVTGGIAFRDGDGQGSFSLATGGGDGGIGGTNDDGEFGDNTSESDQLASRGGFGGSGGTGSSGTVSGYTNSHDGTDTGFVLGAGVEMKLSHNASVGLEGLWYSFDSDGDDRDSDFAVVRARLTMHLNRTEQSSYKDSFIASPVANWAGFYIGANAGAAFRDANTVDDIKTANGNKGLDGRNGAAGNDNGENDGVDDPGGAGGGGGGGAAALVSFDQSSLIGGVHLGYNWQDGSRIIGLEGDANWGDDSFQDYLASVRLRVGYAFDQLLIYGTAGIAFSGNSSGAHSVSLTGGGKGGDGGAGCFENVPNHSPDTCELNPLGGGFGGDGGKGGTASVTRDGGSDEIGFVIGGGFEVKLRDDISLGAEGLYYGFDAKDGRTSASSFVEDDDLSTFVIRGRLTYHLQEARQPLK